MFRNLIIIFWTAFLCNYASASVTVSVNGSNHTIPQTNEKGWGSNVTAWIQAISAYTLQNSGGTFTLTAEVNTGATYGFKVPYIKTATSTPSTAGVLRLANTDAIGWRNAGDSGNLLLAADSSNRLTWNGSAILPSGALTASRALVSDASGVVSAATTTSTEIGYVNGVTSAIQTQLNAKAPAASPTFSGTITTPLTASRALTTGSSSELAVSSTTATELGYVNGVTSAIQTQLDAKQSRSTLTTKGDIYVATASATVARQAVGADGTFLKADSGQTNGVTWATVAGTALSVVTRDTTDTVDTSEDVVLLTASGGAWTETLYTASGNTGKILRLVKTGHDTTAVTIDGNSSETIGGVATIQLVKIGDFIQIISDGTNWQILADRITASAKFHTCNGYGSTNTVIRKFSTQIESIGNAFTVSNDATNGLSVTINVPGNYSFSFSNNANASDGHGFSLNSAQLTTAIASITAADRMTYDNTGAADVTTTTAWTGHLAAGDVVRPHASGTAASSVPGRCFFSAVRM